RSRGGREETRKSAGGGQTYLPRARRLHESGRRTSPGKNGGDITMISPFPATITPRPMTEMRSELAVEEYRALRATIRERGTARVVITTFTFVAWAALVLTVQAVFPQPVSSLIPLLVLGAGFESVFSLHIGVERIGRYLQARYETPAEGAPAWEHTAMQFGRDPSLGG